MTNFINITLDMLDDNTIMRLFVNGHRNASVAAQNGQTLNANDARKAADWFIGNKNIYNKTPIPSNHIAYVNAAKSTFIKTSKSLRTAPINTHPSVYQNNFRKFIDGKDVSHHYNPASKGGDAIGCPFETASYNRARGARPMHTKEYQAIDFSNKLEGEKAFKNLYGEEAYKQFKQECKVNFKDNKHKFNDKYDKHAKHYKEVTGNDPNYKRVENEAVKTVTNNCIFTSDSVINQAIDRFGAIVQQTVKDDLISIFITSLIASTLTKIPDLIRGRESKMSILKHIIKETLTSTAQGMCLTVLTKAVLEVIGNTFPGLHTPIIIYSNISRIIMFYNLAKAAINLAFEIYQAIQDRRIEDLNKDEPEMTEIEVEEFISTCAPLEYRTMQERIDELKAEKEAEKELARLNHENDPKTIAIKEAYAIRLQELGITQEGFNDKPVSKQIIIKHKSVSVDEQAIKANKTLSDSMNQRNIDAELINKSAKTVAEKAKEEFYSKLKINTKPVIINQSKAKQNAPRTFIGCQNGFAMYA